jgi:hypothetical protein
MKSPSRLFRVKALRNLYATLHLEVLDAYRSRCQGRDFCRQRCLNCVRSTRVAMKPQPLNDAEFDRLSGVLGRFDNKRPMNLEQLDGFFAALICGPVNVPPSEYLLVILGDDMVPEDTLDGKTVLQDFLSLLMRHWNVIVDTLQSDEVYLPLLLQDEDGITCQRLGKRLPPWNGAPKSGLG